MLSLHAATLLLGLALGSHLATGHPMNDPGHLLARQLGMTTPEQVREAFSYRNLAAPPPKPAPDAAQKMSQAKEVFNKVRQFYMAQVDQNNNKEALVMMDDLIKKEADKDKQSNLLAFLRYDRISLLKMNNRYIEAFVEAQRFRQLLLQLGEPVSYADKILWELEQQLENLSPYHKLQLEPGASKQDVRKAYKSMMMMLHPDKLGSKSDLDDNAKTYLAGLYDKVRLAYESLVQ